MNCYLILEPLKPVGDEKTPLSEVDHFQEPSVFRQLSHANDLVNKSHGTMFMMTLVGFGRCFDKIIDLTTNTDPIKMEEGVPHWIENVSDDEKTSGWTDERISHARSIIQQLCRD